MYNIGLDCSFPFIWKDLAYFHEQFTEVSFNIRSLYEFMDLYWLHLANKILERYLTWNIESSCVLVGRVYISCTSFIHTYITNQNSLPWFLLFGYKTYNPWDKVCTQCEIWIRDIVLVLCYWFTVCKDGNNGNILLLSCSYHMGYLTRDNGAALRRTAWTTSRRRVYEPSTLVWRETTQTHRPRRLRGRNIARIQRVWWSPSTTGRNRRGASRG